MTHQFNNHIAGTYITLTGSTNQPNQDREAHSDDFPGPGAILNDLERIGSQRAAQRFAPDLAEHSRARRIGCPASTAAFWEASAIRF